MQKRSVTQNMKMGKSALKTSPLALCVPIFMFCVADLFCMKKLLLNKKWYLIVYDSAMKLKFVNSSLKVKSNYFYYFFLQRAKSRRFFKFVVCWLCFLPHDGAHPRKLVLSGLVPANDSADGLPAAVGVVVEAGRGRMNPAGGQRATCRALNFGLEILTKFYNFQNYKIESRRQKQG